MGRTSFSDHFGGVGLVDGNSGGFCDNFRNPETRRSVYFIGLLTGDTSLIYERDIEIL